MDITYTRTLHDAQRAIFNDVKRFRVTCNGRRWGKSRLVLDELIRASLGFTGEMSATSPQVVIGALPTAVQARPILWKPLVNLFTNTDLKHTVKSINLSDMVIEVHNKPSIKVVGANDKNGDRLRGNRIAFVAMDECQDINPVVWSEVVRPALSDTKGSRAIFTGTPKGKVNFLYELSKMYEKHPDEWAFHTFGTETNPTIPKGEIEQARASLPSRVFQQEYEASFVSFSGQVWDDLTTAHLVHPSLVPHCDLVVMGLDFGDKHPAVVVLGRESRSMSWYILDSWSPNTTTSGESKTITRPVFEQLVIKLVYKYNVSAIYCDPSRPSDILAIREFGAAPGFSNCVSAFNGIQSGIAQVGKLVYNNKLFIVDNHKTDAAKAKGYLTGQQTYDFLLSYHWVTDKFGACTEVPADGSFAHICDALRYGLAYRGG